MGTSSSGESDINFDNMKKILAPIFLICYFFTLFSCSKNGCSFSTGATSNQTRNVSTFNQIILYDKINLILKQDSIQSVNVETKSNLLDGIKTEVSDSVLTIKNANQCVLLANPDQVVNVYVSSSQLQQLSYYGAGNVTSTNTLHSDQFTVDSWYGTGSIILDVFTNQLNAYIRNNNAQLTFTGASYATAIYCAQEGFIDMFGLNTINLDLDQRSIRDIHINVSGSLKVRISYKGNVFYKGNPISIDSLYTSSGKLIHVQ